MGLKKFLKKAGKTLKKVALPAAALFMTGGLGGSVLPGVFGKSAVAGMGGLGGKLAGGLQGIGSSLFGGGAAAGAGAGAGASGGQGAGGLSALMSLLGGGQQQQQAPQMPQMEDPMAMQQMTPSLQRWKGR